MEDAIASLMNLVGEIKEKISDNEYLVISNMINSIHEHADLPPALVDPEPTGYIPINNAPNPLPVPIPLPLPPSAPIVLPQTTLDEAPPTLPLPLLDVINQMPVEERLAQWPELLAAHSSPEGRAEDEAPEEEEEEEEEWSDNLETQTVEELDALLALTQAEIALCSFMSKQVLRESPLELDVERNGEYQRVCMGLFLSRKKASEIEHEKAKRAGDDPAIASAELMMLRMDVKIAKCTYLLARIERTKR